MKRILLTGFEPFLNYKTNPTMKIAEELNGKTFGQYKIESLILPVDFNEAAKIILDKITSSQPEIVVSLGLAAGRYKITPERIAINIKDGEPDIQGYTPVDHLIEQDGQDGYFTNLPIRQMVNNLIENHYPSEISNTAGTYLCNNVMYSVLHYIKKHNVDCLAGFIHIPASHELSIQHGKIPSWSQSDLTKAIEICIQTIVQEGDKK